MINIFGDGDFGRLVLWDALPDDWPVIRQHQCRGFARAGPGDGWWAGPGCDTWVTQNEMIDLATTV